MKGNPSYTYIAIDKHRKVYIDRFKAELDHFLGRNTSLHKVVPYIFEFLYTSYPEFVPRVVDWVHKTYSINSLCKNSDNGKTSP